jgi:hypothetical protein
MRCRFAGSLEISGRFAATAWPDRLLLANDDTPRYGPTVEGPASTTTADGAASLRQVGNAGRGRAEGEPLGREQFSQRAKVFRAEAVVPEDLMVDLHFF